MAYSFNWVLLHILSFFFLLKKMNLCLQYSDNYYVSTLISALGHSLIPDPNAVKENGDGMEIDDFDSAEILEEAKREIERYRTLDYLIPTYHDTVTVACLEVNVFIILNSERVS